MINHILIIGKVWPEPNSSAAGSRMMQLINIFVTQGWKISFASAARESEFTSDLASLGIDKFNIELNSHSFDDFVIALNPQVVLFDRFTTEEQFGWRVAGNCPSAMRVLDTEDLHCLRSARGQALKEKRAFEKKDLNNDVSKRELGSIYRCDLSLIISTFEMDILTDHFKVEPRQLHYIPFLPEPITTNDIAEWPAFETRTDFISIGNFLHEPNLDAVSYLKADIWPLIRKQLPEAEMHVSGAYPSHKVFDLHDKENGFLIKGRAASVNEAMVSARVCLAPLRFGAGLKGKLIDAMQSGTPNVTTSIGAEAMHGDLPWGGTITDDPAMFADAALALYTDKKEWQTAQLNGIAIVNTFFSKETREKELVLRLTGTYKNLEEHRSQNFTGAMLQFHSNQGTKYLSLWIEAKNKLKIE